MEMIGNKFKNMLELDQVLKQEVMLKNFLLKLKKLKF